MDVSMQVNNANLRTTGGGGITLQQVGSDQPIATFTLQSYDDRQPIQINGIGGLNGITLQPTEPGPNLSSIALQPIFYDGYNNHFAKVNYNGPGAKVEYKTSGFSNQAAKVDYSLIQAKTEPEETVAPDSGYEMSTYPEKPPYPLPSILDGELFKVLNQEGDKISAKCRVCPISKKPIRGTRLSTGNFLSHILRCHPSLKNRVEEKRRERRAGKRHSITNVVQQPSDEFYTNRWHQTLQAQNNQTTPSSPTHAVTEPVVTITETENCNGNTQRVFLRPKEELTDDEGTTHTRSEQSTHNYINVVNMDTLTANGSQHSTAYTLAASHDKLAASASDRSRQEREAAAAERIIAAYERRAKAAEQQAAAEEAIAVAVQRKATAESRIAVVRERQATFEENQLNRLELES